VLGLSIDPTNIYEGRYAKSALIGILGYTVENKVIYALDLEKTIISIFFIKFIKYTYKIVSCLKIAVALKFLRGKEAL